MRNSASVVEEVTKIDQLKNSGVIEVKVVKDS